MTSYKREWSDRRKAVGFAAECARLALRFYAGADRRVVVDAIEVAEQYGRGEGIAAGADDAAEAAYSAHDPDNAYSVHAPGNASFAVSLAAGLAAADAAGMVSPPYTPSLCDPSAADVADHASDAGVDNHELAVAFARWVVRDLSPRWPIDEELRLAASAAVVAGNAAIAREILQMNRENTSSEMWTRANKPTTPKDQ